jgi:hypothetical protein
MRSFLLLFFFSFFAHTAGASIPQTIHVRGEVKEELTLSKKDLLSMDSLSIEKVTLIKEKKRPEDKDERVSMHNYRGVLLKDILLKAGMKHVRKFEPGVFIRVKGSEDEEVVFSFGEIFYSSSGRAILIATEIEGKPFEPDSGIGELIVATDLRAGRTISGVKEIIVERVDIPMNVYEERKKNFERSPSSAFLLTDKRTGKSQKIDLEELKKFDPLLIEDVVLTGDCEGFGGIFSFKGVGLRSLLDKSGINPYGNEYGRYVLVYSENGFAATFSFGEIFNSRLSDNFIIAYEKDDKPLDQREAFAMSAVREDSMGGRSVKRISCIEIR